MTGSRSVGVAIDEDMGTVVLTLADGCHFFLPWDYFRYRADPGYRAVMIQFAEESEGQLATRIAAWRRHSGLSQLALAEAADLPGTAVSRIESGAKKPSLRVLRALAAAFGITVGELACRDPTGLAA